MTRVNFNKSLKMHKACSTDDLRPVLNCIYFKDGFAYATDGCILVRNDLRQCSTLTEEHLGLLDGKMLHRNNYQKILGFEILLVEEDRIDAIGRDGERASFMFEEAGEYGFPYCDKIISDLVNTPYKEISTIGMDLKKMATLVDAFESWERCMIHFCGDEKGVRFTSLNPDSMSVAVIMPLNKKSE